MNKIISNFVYHNFHPTEAIEIVDDEKLVYRNKNKDDFPDRYVLLKIKNDAPQSTTSSDFITALKNGISTDTDADGIDDDFIVLSQTSTDPDITGNVFFTQDFIQGFVRISPDNLQNEITFQRKTLESIDSSNNSSVAIKSILDYLKMNMKNSEYLSGDMNQYEKALRGDSSINGIDILDPNTNLPITTTDVSPVSTSGDAYISSPYADKIFRRSKESPAVWNLTKRTVLLSELISRQTYENRNQRKLSNMYQMLGQDAAGGIPITGISSDFEDGKLHFVHIGWHAIKYIKDGENYRFDSSFLLFADGAKETHEIYPGASNDVGIIDGVDDYHVFKDPYVLYGQTYRYEIRDAWAIYRKPITGDEKTFILLGTQSVNMELKCVENVPPPTPSNFGFEYVGDDTIKVNWTKELRLTEKMRKFEPDEINPDAEPYEVDDISGYLLFLRSSLQDPYQLVNQFHINMKQFTRYNASGEIDSELSELKPTGVPNSIIGASIPNDQIVIISDGKNQEHLLEIRSNQDYFITFCSYDTHGNISNYSEQFFIRRNNVTGEVSTKLVSPKGASLAYPNALMASKFILSSMKSSGYKYMDVYQTPDLSTTYPTSGEGMTIHLIDLETEEDQVISSVDGNSSQT